MGNSKSHARDKKSPLVEAISSLPVQNWYTLYNINDPKQIIARFKPSWCPYLVEEALALGQLSADGTFYQYAGSFPAAKRESLDYFMRDSDHWYRVSLRLFLNKGAVVGTLSVVQDPSRSVNSTISEPCISVVPPEYTQVIVK